VVDRLTSADEYLHDVPGAPALPVLLREFGAHILTTAVDPAQTWFWTTHVGAHPPGAFLVFVALDRIGLGGGGAAGLLVIAVGASAAAAVLVAARAMGDEQVARRAAPFAVLFPGAVWVGVSADGLFAGVLAWGVALLAVAAARTGWRSGVAARQAGLLLGGTVYLSYGLVLGGLLAAAVLVRPSAGRRLRVASGGLRRGPGGGWGLGIDRGPVARAGFAAGGRGGGRGRVHAGRVLLVGRLREGPRDLRGQRRRGAAVLLLRVGEPGRRGVRDRARGGRGPAPHRDATRRPLPGRRGRGAAMLVADLSGMSKAEVERIWLPFAVWTCLACAELPRPRRWLAAQAVVALLVNHLLLTVW
jgi:hypothetical protein